MSRTEARVTVDGGAAAGVRTDTHRAALERLPHLELASSALLTMLWIELVRLWFPTVAASALGPGSASAVRSFTLTTSLAVAAAVLAMIPVPRGAARHRFALAAAALIAVRTAMTFGPTGDTGQLVLVGLGVAAGIVALVGLASASPRPRLVRIGVGAGVLAGVIVHAATTTRGLIWAPTGWTFVISLVLVAAAAITSLWLWRAWGDTAAMEQPGTRARIAACWPWWSLTPLLVLVLAVSAVPGRTMVATGWSANTAAMAVAAIHLGAGVLVGLRPRLPRVPTLALVALGLPAAVLAASDGQGWPVVLGQTGVAVGVALLVSAPEPEPTGRDARLRGLIPGAAFVLTLAFIGLYELTDRHDLVLDNLGVHALVGLLGSAMAVALIRVGPTAVARPRIDVRRLLTVMVTAAMIVAAIGALGPRQTTSDDTAPPLDELRVGLVNVGSGFDPQGRMIAAAQGRFLADLELDVVVLTEVDRGRMAAGGHDGLHLLAAEVGFDTILFAPAADQVSGLALLTRLDVSEIAREQLPTGDDPQRRGSLAAVVSWPGETPLGLIAAQLSDHEDQGDTRLPQARAVAGTVALLRERQVATVVLADLRADAASPELNTFTSLLHDALPEGTRTVPADDPDRRDEHVLLSPELRRTDLGLPRVPWSDRLPVIVTLERIEPVE
jgi:endonuclease/exonuclease/phosphatase family metal-dependent hydrolase